MLINYIFIYKLYFLHNLISVYLYPSHLHIFYFHHAKYKYCIFSPPMAMKRVLDYSLTVKSIFIQIMNAVMLVY